MLRHNFYVIVLFARMFMVFNRLHFYLGHNFSEVFIFPAGEEEGHHKSQSRHTCPDTGQCGFETVRLTCLKLGM